MLDGIEAMMEIVGFGLWRGRTKQKMARTKKNKGIGAGGSMQHDHNVSKMSRGFKSICEREWEDESTFNHGAPLKYGKAKGMVQAWVAHFVTTRKCR